MRNFRSQIFISFSIIAIVVAGFFLTIGPAKTISGITSVAISIFKIKQTAGQGISDGLELSKSKNTLIEEKKLLAEKISELETALAILPTMKDENYKLTEILARKKENSQQAVARILAKPNQTIYDTLLIDLGSDDGILVGARVLAQGNIPIGLVSEADLKTSKVKLFSTSGEITKAVIVGPDIFIDLKGQGGGTFETTLPRDIVIEKGTTVAELASGQTIAVMEETLADSRDPFQRILFRSPVNFFELRFVGVEK